MKKKSSANMVIVLLLLIIIYLLFKYVIPRIFVYAAIIFAFIPPLINSIVGIAIVILIFYLIYKFLRKK